MATVKRRRDRWVLDFYDHKGKRRWKTMPEGTTKKAAKDYLRRIEDQVKKGIYLPDKRIPTFKKVAADWLEHKKPNIRMNSWRKYDGYIRRQLAPLKDTRIDRITIATVEKFIAAQQENGMHPGTLKKVLVVFNQIMKYAVRHRYVDSNPVREAERPRDNGTTQELQIRILLPEQITALLDAVDNLKYRTLFMLAIMSGAREGELFGLKWTDIDWFNRQIHIQRTWNEGRWYKPKSKASNRRIDIGPATIKALKQWRLACPSDGLDLVFPSENGTPLACNNMLRRHFYPALKKANLPQMRFHDLRHTYASLLIDQGENVKYIQKQLGHASPMVTLSVYAHLLNPVNQEAAGRLEKRLFSENGSKMVANNKKGADA